MLKQITLNYSKLNFHNTGGKKSYNKISKLATNKESPVFVWLEKLKNNILNHLNVKYIKGSRTFWKVIKSFFSKKPTRNENIALVKLSKVITTDREQLKNIALKIIRT